VTDPVSADPVDELLPQKFQINAWTGGPPAGASGPAAEQAETWIFRNAPPTVRTYLRAPEPADPRNWQDERVGWGLVLAETPGLSAAALARADDAPEPIRQLVADRSGTVFRYRPGWEHRFRFLRDYKNGKDVAIAGSAPGTKPGHLPRYLLIYGSPADVPWTLQYELNASCSVGRLSLTGDALANYVGALRAGWKASAQPYHTLVWAVNHGGTDITVLMRDVIAERVQARYKADNDINANAVFLDGPPDATAARLRQELAHHQPGVIVTTSHGMTGPLDQLDVMRAQLGMLVDQSLALVRPEDLLNDWEPNGAIWYAHACCSAGSDAQSLFTGVVQTDSEIDKVLQGVAKLGALVSPLPQALLGARRPLRAFVGHVEPTFDWTLRQPANRQVMTDALEKALYENLMRPAPVGFAFRELYDRLGGLYVGYENSRRDFNAGGNTQSSMLYHLLVARDIQSLVILGDPTAMLPID